MNNVKRATDLTYHIRNHCALFDKSCEGRHVDIMKVLIVARKTVNTINSLKGESLDIYVRYNKGISVSCYIETQYDAIPFEKFIVHLIKEALGK